MEKGTTVSRRRSWSRTGTLEFLLRNRLLMMPIEVSHFLRTG